ncbi:trypsin-like peptidase domain-containing protein [Balneolaceae bacterium ANBcel3]|nr:trypsin-like peptidase domain-containing protein [Balneolaceae bacterium ANBcel3]
MKKHQIILTGILLLLIGVLLGVLMMVTRGSWIPPERIEVRYTEVTRSSEPLPVSGPNHPENAFRAIADSIVRGVVYIETDVRRQGVTETESGDGAFWDRIWPQRRGQSIGSGVIITKDGYIITNHHVIHGSGESIRVLTHDNRYFEAKVIGSDPSTDLAVLKIDLQNGQPLVIGNSDHVGIGDWVMAVGNPFRLRSTVTAGIISAIGRDVDIINERMRIESFIQTDAAINRGNSGGALVNMYGELIGINTAIASESGAYQGYGFAIPVNLAMKVTQDLIQYGEVRRAYMGVEISNLDFDQARRSGLDHISGVVVRSLVRGGSADLGGLEQGDIILEVDGYRVNQANRLQERIALLRPGDLVELTIWRNQKEQSIAFPVAGMDNEAIRSWAQVEQEKESDRIEMEQEDLGVRQLNVEEYGFSVAELANQEDLSIMELVVISVKERGEAYYAGLKVDDIILRINGTDIQQLDEFKRIWDTSAGRQEPVRVDVKRNGEIHFLFFDAG